MSTAAMLDLARLLASASLAMLTVLLPLTAALLSYTARERKRLMREHEKTTAECSSELSKLSEDATSDPSVRLRQINQRIRAVRRTLRAAKAKKRLNSGAILLGLPIFLLTVSLTASGVVLVSGLSTPNFQKLLLAVSASSLVVVIMVVGYAMLSMFRQACREATIGPDLSVLLMRDELPKVLIFDREYELKFQVSNMGDAEAKNLGITLAAPPGIELEDGTAVPEHLFGKVPGRVQALREIGTLHPGEYSFPFFRMKLLSQAGNSPKIVLLVRGENTAIEREVVLQAAAE